MSLMKLKKIDNQFVKYGIVGIFSVFIDYILLYISYTIFELSSSISVTIGFWGSTIVNFLLHRFYTFSVTQEEHHLKSLVKYLFLVFGSYFITLYLINSLVLYAVNIYIAKFIVLIIVYIYGFFIGKYFVFK